MYLGDGLADAADTLAEKTSNAFFETKDAITDGLSAGGNFVARRASKRAKQVGSGFKKMG